jgi:hypothetical protein
VVDIGSLGALKREKTAYNAIKTCFRSFFTLLVIFSIFWLPGEAHKRPKSWLKKGFIFYQIEETADSRNGVEFAC